MTIQECITFVDGIEPNAYTSEQKARWVQNCEGRIFTQVFLQQPTNGTEQAAPVINGQELTGLEAILAQELSVPEPYDRVYPSYLRAMIHYANGEYDRYAASQQMYNDAWHELNRWFGRDFDIADRYRNRRVTVAIQPGETSQTLLAIPPHCAFVGGRIVVKRTFSSPGESNPLTATLRYGAWDSIGAWKLRGGQSAGIKVLVGDAEGTALSLDFRIAAEVGEAYLTGVLCLPEEELLYQGVKVAMASSGGGGTTEDSVNLRFIGQAVSVGTNQPIVTISSPEITADYVLAEITFKNPSYITTGYTWTTTEGSFVLTGTATAETTVDILLVKESNLRFRNQAVSAGVNQPILTISSPEITADHALAEITFSNPSYITDGYTWTTEEGSFVLTGTATAPTAADILLVREG